MKLCPTNLWDADSLWERDTWQLTLPDEVVDDYSHYRERHPTAQRGPETIAFDPEETPTLAWFADRVRWSLLAADGLCWIRGLGDLGLGEDEQRGFYAALGCALGDPMVEYGVLHEVADRGDSYREQAIPVSQTAAGTGFHTDSSARDVVPDFVGLLCEEPSSTGGDSLVSNAVRVHELLRRWAPDVLALLSEDYVRDIVTPGAERPLASLRRNRFPIFAPCRLNPGMEFRYMRDRIECGQQRVGRPLSDSVIEALDLLDDLLASREQAVRLRLEAGDMLWVNNRTVAHDRCAYDDVPGARRRLQRMWIQVA